MPIPDLNDRALFPPFAGLPEEGAATTNKSTRYLLAQIKDDMTINKPTLVLADRDGHPFALVFDGLDRDGLDLAQRGLKKGATAVVCDACQCVPAAAATENETLTGKAARRPFVRIAPGQAHTVQAVPGRLEQTVAAADKLRRVHSSSTATCHACGAAGGEAQTKLLKCTGCGQAQYCNRTCQTSGWTDGHKSECKAWRALTAIWP